MIIDQYKCCLVETNFSFDIRKKAAELTFKAKASTKLASFKLVGFGLAYNQNFDAIALLYRSH